MTGLWLVVGHEIGVTLRKPVFWLFTLLAPALLIGINAFSQLRDTEPAIAQAGAQAEPEAPAQLPTIGLVDEAGLSRLRPRRLTDFPLLPFATLAEAQRALEEGAVAQVVHIPVDYLEAGEVIVLARNFSIRMNGGGMGVAFASRHDWVVPELLGLNLVGDEQLLAALRDPVPGARISHHRLRPPDDAATPETDTALAELVGTIIPFAYYFVFVLVGSYLLRSVAAEKESRTVELLLTSLRPPTLMAGKLVGLSVVALLQLTVWGGLGWYALDFTADRFELAAFAFPRGFAVWAVLYLLFGYLLFASITVAAGAVSSKARESGPIVWLLIVPLLPTLILGQSFIEHPDGALPVALSLFPLSAPSAMVTRLAAAPVPLWQLLISLTGVALAAYLMLLLAGRVFRSGNLLSNDPFAWSRLLAAWRGASSRT